MAKKKKTAAGADIDWYLISIDRLKQIGLVVLILLAGVAAWFFYNNQKGNPRSNAESAIADARQALDALAASKDINAHRGDFDRAKRKLEEANNHFGAGRYPEAQGAAVESQTISRTASSGNADRENDAQFLTVEGDVRFQKGGAGDFKPAESRTALFNGDWVKTGDNASAELIFSTGSLYTIGANALLEITATVNPSTSKKTNSVQMTVGSVEVATTDDASTVRTPSSQIVVDSESTTQVGVTQDKATAVMSTKGSASVTSAQGGAPVKLASGEKVTSAPDGALSTVKKLALPPALTAPADNQVFPIAADSKVEFTWEPQQGVTGYLLEVSRSRLFTTLEINTKRLKPSAGATLSQEGAFYWRVASIGPDGDVGPFSPFRRFRASGGGKSSAAPSAADAKPPKLQLKAPFNIGGRFWMFEGTTDPGTTVFINNEEVEVEANGHFKKLVDFSKVGRNDAVVKAVSPAGVPTVQSQTVIVNEE